MWNVSWDSTNALRVVGYTEVIELIERINEEYKHKEPIIVQIESATNKVLTIGVGSIEERCCLDFFPDATGLGSLHPVPHPGQASEGSIVFWYDSYDSEWETNLLIPYHDAIKELSYFLTHDDISADLIWEPD